LGIFKDESIGKTYSIVIRKVTPFFYLFFVCLFFMTGSHCIAQAGLELAILLSLPPECWDYRCEPSFLAKLVFVTSSPNQYSKMLKTPPGVGAVVHW
jgi:hypothetical protein